MNKKKQIQQTENQTSENSEIEISMNREKFLKNTLSKMEAASTFSNPKTKYDLVSAGTERITVKHELTPAELEKKGGELAQVCAQREQAEDQKKQINSEFKFKIDSYAAAINLLSAHISQKFFMENVEAKLMLDFKNKKRIFQKDGVIIHTEPLREEDFQLKASVLMNND